MLHALPLWLSLALASPPSGPGPQFVVGGSTPAEGVWPATAAFAYGSGYVACTGVLIHPEWVLTAGHCAPNPSAIYLDTVELDSPGEVRGVDGFIPYPDAFSTFDVALAHLDTPSEVEPVHLALDCVASDWIRAGADVTVVGFGATDAFGQDAATALQSADTTVVDPECVDEYSGCNVAAMPAGELIAGGDGIDSCVGDSGGPIFVWAAGEPWLAGTVSRAAVPAQEPCGSGGIYVRADAVADWIEQTTDIVLDRPDCVGMNRPPVVEAPPLVLGMGQVGWIELEIRDPNLGQTHTVELVEPPTGGWAHIVDTEVAYVPQPNYFGPDALTVRVTDSGTPVEWVELTVPIQVRSAVSAHSGGCSHAPGPVGSALLLGLLLGIRRR